MNRGKRAAAFFPLFLAAVAALMLAHGGGATANAQSASMLGIDVEPDSNTPASLGTLETCASHEVGDEFNVDIFVNNVNDLRGWELRLQYDEDVLSVAAVDFAHFLVSTPPGGNIFPTLQENESPGRDFLAAAELSGPADSGSGVLARLTMDAIGEGTSTISIADSPYYLGPRLTTAYSGAIGDDNGDGIWDASILDSEVVVGGRCDGSSVVTPKPSPKSTPRASGAAAATATPIPIGNNADGSTSTAIPGVVVVVPGDDNDSGSGGGDDPGDPVAEPGNDSGNESDDGNGSASDPTDGGIDNAPSDSSAGDDGGGGSADTWLIVAALAAASFMGLGAAFYVVSRRM